MEGVTKIKEIDLNNRTDEDDQYLPEEVKVAPADKEEDNLATDIAKDPARDENSPNVLRELKERQHYLTSKMANMMMWDLLAIEGAIKYQAQQMRISSQLVRQQLAGEVKKLWDKYNDRLDISTRLGSVSLSGI